MKNLAGLAAALTFLGGAFADFQINFYGDHFCQSFSSDQFYTVGSDFGLGDTDEGCKNLNGLNPGSLIGIPCPDSSGCDGFSCQVFEGENCSGAQVLDFGNGGTLGDLQQTGCIPLQTGGSDGNVNSFACQADGTPI